MTNFYIGKNALDEDVYCASVNGMAIYNPYKSECGRFKVEPSYYDLSDIDVKVLAYLNEVNGFNTEV
jgi:hypothetical protein